MPHRSFYATRPIPAEGGETATSNTPAAKRRRLEMPAEGWLRLGFSFVFTIAALGTSPNPFGNIQEIGAYSQVLAILGILQFFEFMIVLVRANPTAFSRRSPKQTQR